MEPWGPGILSEDAWVEGKLGEGWGCAVVQWGPQTWGHDALDALALLPGQLGGEDQRTDGRKTQREGEGLYEGY